MAQKYITQVVDDIDGKVLEEDQFETVKFSVDGQGYNMDVSLKHAKEFRSAVEKYTAVARPDNSRSFSAPKSGSKKKSSASADLTEVREWATKNGFQISTRGRIPQAVMTAFDAAK